MNNNIKGPICKRPVLTSALGVIVMSYLDENAIPLSIDLYELTMGASYHALGMDGRATFSLFVRSLPPGRSFLVVAGVEDALRRLENLRFDERALEYIATLPQVRPDFVEYLRSFRFEGDVWAVPEGSIVFPNEPVLEITAPIIHGQIAEPVVMNALHYPTLVATKAARCVLAAQGKPLFDFGLRRAPEIDGGLAAARACYLAGFSGTSNVLAGKVYGIPVVGTMAHSFVESFPNERLAFEGFVSTFPHRITLLIDTYDVLMGAQHVVEVSRKFAGAGKQISAVRIDSGDLEALSRQVRKLLDSEGLQDIKIMASGGLDEYEIDRLLRNGAPIDSFGVGTRVVTAEDAPVLDMSYKLVQFDGRPKLKLSEGKRTIVGAKQLWRRIDTTGLYAEDMISGREEPAPDDGEWLPLLRPMMKAGRITESFDLEEARRQHAREVERLPSHLRDIHSVGEYKVTLSSQLQERQRLAEEMIAQEEGLAAKPQR